jgi:hypothetical protein
MKLTTPLTVLAVAAGLGSVSAQEKWTIRPSEVGISRHSLLPTDFVTGSFTFARDDANGVASTKMGGACLIADLTGQGIGRKQCTNDDQCNPYTGGRSPLGPSNPTDPDWEGYCVRPTVRSGDSGLHGRCWIRPGSHKDYCTSSVTLGGSGDPVPLQAGTYDLPRVPARPTYSSKPVSWRIHTCLNHATTTGSKPPCRHRNNPDKEQRNGPIFVYQPGRRSTPPPEQNWERGAAR